MKQGKLTNVQLNESILSKLKPMNEETVLGAGVGEDCCAVDLGDICVVSTDPITAANAKAGSLAIHINANDVASAGAVPVAALVTILLPVDAQNDQLKEIVSQLTDTARSLNIDIIGGHTEVTESVNRAIVSVTMIGRPVNKGVIFRTADMQPGDDIVMTKYAGLEGTSIIMQDFAAEAQALLGDAEKAEAEFVENSLSVVREGVAAAGVAGVSAMHDITEGGVKGAVAEMCEACGLGATIYFSRVPVLGITQKLCAHYALDVYSLISSGSMLISAGDGAALCAVLEAQGISACVIGRAKDSGLTDGDTGESFAPPERDELYRVLERAR